MTGRLAVLLAAAVAGMFFAPVFGLAPLLVPIVVPLALVFVVAELCSGRETLVAWRPLLLAAVGLLGVVETVLFSTTTVGLPTGATFSALASGVTKSWQLTLQSTWPARPDPAQLLFVPLLVLLAGVLGVEMLRLRRPLPALVPSFAVVVVSQFYAALSGKEALVGGLGYLCAAGLLCASATGGERRKALIPMVPAVVLGLVVAVVAALVIPASGPAFSVKRDQVAQLSATVASPLHDIAYRLEHPNTPVFSVHGTDTPDRWPLVVLDSFDGVNWTPGTSYRRLGTELAPGAAVTVPTQPRTAQIALTGLGGPWLPSQTWPAAVAGADPLVEETQGSLWLQKPGATDYTLSWWEPQIRPADLLGAEIDPDAADGLGGVGAVPPDVGELVPQATAGLRPSFESALALERFFRDRYHLASGTDLPSGDSWPQLRKFLFTTKVGTSEQFAAAYVALARISGIPARLVVGYRTPAAPGLDGTRTVHNGDVLAWPEVAVKDVGWVPLDPTGTVQAGGGNGTNGLAAVTAQARAQLPPAEQMTNPPVAPARKSTAADDESDDWAFPLLWVLVALAALLAAWLLGVPLAKRVRSWRRRRRPGAGAVLGACLEVRDRLREHHVPCAAGMTVRDLAAAAAGVGNQSVVDGLRSLGSTVDLVLWSGAQPGPQAGPLAWTAVRQVRRGLARRGLRARLRAAVDPRTLLPTRE